MKMCQVFVLVIKMISKFFAPLSYGVEFLFRRRSAEIKVQRSLTRHRSK